MRKLTKFTLVAAMAAGLAGCGDTFGEQALLGGGAGAAAAVVTDTGIGTGIVIGAAANVLYCKQYPSRC